MQYFIYILVISILVHIAVMWFAGIKKPIVKNVALVTLIPWVVAVVLSYFFIFVLPDRAASGPYGGIEGAGIVLVYGIISFVLTLKLYKLTWLRSLVVLLSSGALTTFIFFALLFILARLEA